MQMPIVRRMFTCSAAKVMIKFMAASMVTETYGAVKETTTSKHGLVLITLTENGKFGAATVTTLFKEQGMTESTAERAMTGYTGTRTRQILVWMKISPVTTFAVDQEMTLSWERIGSLFSFR